MHSSEDQKTELVIANLLRGGVLLAAFVVLTGGILYLAHYGGQSPEYGVFRGEPSDLRHVSGILEGVLHFKRRALIQFGLLLLVATPIARVVFSAVVFLKQRDYLYVAITLLVLGLLLFSLMGG